MREFSFRLVRDATYREKATITVAAADENSAVHEIQRILKSTDASEQTSNLDWESDGAEYPTVTNLDFCDDGED